MSKKILVVAPYSFLPYRSGGQKYIAQFLNALGQQTKVTVVSTAQDDGYVPSEHYRLLPVLPYSFFRYIDLTLKATLIDLIERNHYDWIIWEHPYFGWLARAIKQKTGIKTLIHTHNIEYQRFRSLGKIWWPLLEKYERNTFRIADKIGFISAEDRQFAINNWQINAGDCLEIPYGTTLKQCPTDKESCRKKLIEKHNINSQQTILFFNGSLDYAPNYSALQQLLNKLMPKLQSAYPDCFVLLISGKGISKKDKHLQSYQQLNAYYIGFVEDIDLYFKGADIFLNPVTKGGGVKTKMIESISFGTPVVAMKTAAQGLDENSMSGMLRLSPNGDWNGFATEIHDLKQQLPQLQTPASFYEKHNWENIITAMVNKL